MAERSFDIDVGPIVVFAKRMEGMERPVRDELTNAMNDAAEYVRDDAARNAPRGLSGNLGRRMEKVVVVRARDLTGRVFNRLPYARFVHDGRGWVYPRRARVLRWVDRSGKVVFSRKSRPAKAQPFLTDALARQQPRIRRRFADAQRRIVARATGVDR